MRHYAIGDSIFLPNEFPPCVGIILDRATEDEAGDWWVTRGDSTGSVIRYESEMEHA